MFSYWERESFWKKPDVVIVGSGIVGLNAALALKKKAPSLDLRVVERGFLPYGASTRNAGFACFGSVTELLADLKVRSMDEVMTLVEARLQGLNELRALVGDDRLGYEALGGFEIFLDKENSFHEAASAIHLLNSELEKKTGLKDVFVDAENKISEFGLKGVNHMIRNTAEGQLDTGKMMNSLMDLAKSNGIKIHTGVTVHSIEESEKEITLLSTEGFRLPCDNVLLATNGLTSRIAKGLDVNPARAQVFITEPVPGLKVKGSFHYEEGYYYFRNVGERILFGGARNTDFEAEATDKMGLTEKIQSRLETFLQEHILPDTDMRIEMRWSGIMGIGNGKDPIIRRLSERSWCGVRMGGMGIAIGTTAGRRLADLFLSER